jgi:hypothetical protein
MPAVTLFGEPTELVSGLLEARTTTAARRGTSSKLFGSTYHSSTSR